MVAFVAESGRGASGLRVIADPFVVAPPRGVHTRSRVRVTATEDAALTRIGEVLGVAYRQTLASRLRLGAATSGQVAEWRRVTKKSLTPDTSARWAGAITRTAQDSYRTGMRGLGAEVASLSAAVAAIAARLAVPMPESGRNVGRSERKAARGYATASERHAKSRRKAQLEERLAAAMERQSAGHPRVVVGGGQLWRNRHHLAAAKMTLVEWDRRWADGRMFFTADGESGKSGGNETIRVSADGSVDIKVPGALASEFGVRLSISAPVSMATHRGDEWTQRVADRQAIRYDLHRDARGRWYIDASWTRDEPVATPLAGLRAHRTLGVDLNNGHVDAAVIDPHGNVVGVPQRIDYRIDGTAGHRDAQVRHVVSRLIHMAVAAGCASISIENLGFDDARSTGRETMGRGRRGKRFRRVVAGLPTSRFRDRLAAMASTAGVSVIAVDPAYTSRWGKQHWLAPLRDSDSTVDGHRAAAVVIGRRGLGHRARRKSVEPLVRQRTHQGQSAVPAVRGSLTSRSRVTVRPRARDAAGSPDD
ncbi:hypothetical protein Xcel_3231 [Xylanimonas cellulosilytica DSM 15894]|uniref:Transposase n=1 Tax=Xylanimonas cellulosilytica (strain DSM 15894 / JCM 12276 / CECT 5975 / KCTC 9989 / LMG 20990 / NBRC 107835 / XIL07) TaxID=446471 RepID=D1C0M8_XYLCX|nr:hypothetical protein [Xylanimonas cellulosilytica]ACZ32231.1 hypothetical protein Xcel_3231 [Xylanimonas cellulosilytica DSM 15894]